MSMKISTRFIKLIMLTVLLTSAIDGMAQKKKGSSGGGARPAFEKGSKTLGLSLGYYGDVRSLPAFTVMYDQGIINNVGPGTIGIGGIVGAKFASYKYSSGGYKATWANYIVAARGTYHLTILKDKNNKFDPYAGVTVGLRFNNYEDSYYDHFGYYNPNSYNSVYPVVGVFVGAKYNFSKNFGAFSELGYDISFFRIGINFNF